MLFGAAAAAWIGGHVQLSQPFHPVVALMGAAFFGALWGLVPAVLKEFIGVNEIISTLLLNSVAGVLVGLVRLGRLSETARLLPLVASTKVTAGILLAVTTTFGIYLFLWRTARGLEIRNSAQAPRFALSGGIARHATVLRAMAISGALAGLAGAVEVLGVQYKFVTTFSAINDFDGLIVAFAGHLHPFGVLLFSFLLGGLRAGSIVGLQIRSGVPRELGGALIALLLIFAAMHKFYRTKK
jgi:simple sugar transport system permease protein